MNVYRPLNYALRDCRRNAVLFDVTANVGLASSRAAGGRARCVSAGVDRINRSARLRADAALHREVIFETHRESRYSSALSSKEFRPARSALPTPRRVGSSDKGESGCLPREQKEPSRADCAIAIVRVRVSSLFRGRDSGFPQLTPRRVCDELCVCRAVSLERRHSRKRRMNVALVLDLSSRECDAQRDVERSRLGDAASVVASSRPGSLKEREAARREQRIIER